MWYVPKGGGQRHFFFTLETQLFHFPDADPDCWYITSIEPFDPIPWHIAREEAAAKARSSSQANAQPIDPHPPDKPP